MQTRWARWSAAAVLAASLIAAHSSDGPAGAVGATKPYLFAPSFASNAVSMFDLSDNSLVATIGIDARGACCAYATPDGRRVLVVDGLGPYVSTIDVAGRRVTHLTRLRGTLGDRAAPITADGKTLWLSEIPEGHIEAIDIASGRIVHSYPFTSSVFTVSRDGRSLFTANLNANHAVLSLTSTTFAVRDAATGTTLASLALPLSVDVVPLMMYAAPDGTTVYVQQFGTTGTVHVIDVSDRLHPRYLKQVQVGSVPVVATFTPDGRQLWFPDSGDGTVSVLDVHTNQVVRVIHLGCYVAGVAFAADRAYISVSPGVAPGGVLAMAELFVGLIPGAALNPPTGSTQHHLYEMPGEIRTYDVHTYRELPVPPMPLPSVSHVMDVASVR